MPEYHIEKVLPIGTLTGSRAFNCATNKSDWDIVIYSHQLPDYTAADDYQVTDFCDEYLEENPSGGKPGHNVKDYPEFEDEKFIEYDKSTIWGPLEQIIKYWYLTNPDDESTEICINLFVYNKKFVDIHERFKNLNLLMNMCYGSRLQDKETRIDAFIKCISSVGITDL